MHALSAIGRLGRNMTPPFDDPPASNFEDRKPLVTEQRGKRQGLTRPQEKVNLHGRESDTREKRGQDRIKRRQEGGLKVKKGNLRRGDKGSLKSLGGGGFGMWRGIVDVYLQALKLGFGAVQGREICRGRATSFSRSFLAEKKKPVASEKERSKTLWVCEFEATRLEMKVEKKKRAVS